MENLRIDHLNRVENLNDEIQKLKRQKEKILEKAEKDSEYLSSQLKQCLDNHQSLHSSCINSISNTNNKLIPSNYLIDQSVLKVFVFKSDWQGSRLRASNGGPAGELVMYDSIVDALNLDFMSKMYKVTLRETSLTNEDYNDIERSVYDIIVTDQYSLDEGRGLRNLLERKGIGCKFRFLDFWGTPPNQNHIGFHPWQFLNPYPNVWNYPLGLSLAKPFKGDFDIFKHKKPQGVIWGKETKYFLPHLPLLQELAKNFVLHVTLPYDKDLSFLPKEIINHGVLNGEKFHQLLAESKFLLGLEDPLIGPTPITAISVGCVYLDPQFDSAKTTWNNNQDFFNSQHPPLQKLGLPYAYKVSLHDAENVKNVIKRVLSDPTPPLPFIQAEYRIDYIAHRVDANFRDKAICYDRM